MRLGCLVLKLAHYFGSGLSVQPAGTPCPTDSQRPVMIRLLVKIALVVAILAVGLAAGLGYGHMLLGKEREAQNKANELNRRVALLEKKASEEREALSSAEGRNRSLQAELDRLRKENGEQAEDIKKLQSERSEARSLETKLKEMTEEAARMKSDRDKVSAQYAQVFQAAKDLEGQAKLQATGKQSFQASLAKVNRELEACKNHNARLSRIADEFLEKTKYKTSFGGLFQSDALSQSDRAELDKLKREYREKIDQEKVKSIQ
jgi:chromosome segregation ATPase